MKTLRCYTERAQQLVCLATLGQMIEAVDKIEVPAGRWAWWNGLSKGAQQREENKEDPD